MYSILLPTNGGSRNPWESPWSLGIDIFFPVSSLRLRFFQSQSRSCHWDLNFSVSVSVLSLRLRFFSFRLVIETHTFAVLVLSLRLTSFQSRSRHWDLDLSVSVSLLRLWHFQSLSRSRHWDSKLFSLCLVIETQTFSVSAGHNMAIFGEPCNDDVHAKTPGLFLNMLSSRLYSCLIRAEHQSIVSIEWTPHTHKTESNVNKLSNLHSFYLTWNSCVSHS